MTTMTATPLVVTGGVDTHRDQHVAAVIDQVGGVLGTASFPTTSSGLKQLHRWLVTFGEVSKVGIEGTGSYGSALARHLAAAGIEVVEVSRPNRQVRRRHGKTDVVDAIAAARSVLSGESTATPKTHDGPVEALRALKALQRSAHKARTQAINQLRSLVLTAPDGLREQLRDLTRDELIATCSAFRVRADDDTLPAVTRLTMRELARRIEFLDQQLTHVVTRLRRITVATAPKLVAIHGVGPDVAATLLVTAGDNPERLRNERSFAALAGTSPIPVNSGQTQGRYRLNRGGDRQANAALWRIVIVRLGTDTATKAYVERRTKEGKTKGEIIRSLKRYVAREVYRSLPIPALD